MAEPKSEMVERRRGKVAPRDLRIAREFSASLAGHYDRSLFEVTFFGSRARGEGDEESDLDLFVALHQDDPGREVEATALRLACDLTLKHGVLVSALVADRAFLTSHEGYSLLETIEEDGIRL